MDTTKTKHSCKNQRSAQSKTAQVVQADATTTVIEVQQQQDFLSMDDHYKILAEGFVVLSNPNEPYEKMKNIYIQQGKLVRDLENCIGEAEEKQKAPGTAILAIQEQQDALLGSLVRKIERDAVTLPRAAERKVNS